MPFVLFFLSVFLSLSISLSLSLQISLSFSLYSCLLFFFLSFSFFFLSGHLLYYILNAVCSFFLYMSFSLFQSISLFKYLSLSLSSPVCLPLFIIFLSLLLPFFKSFKFTFPIFFILNAF